MSSFRNHRVIIASLFLPNTAVFGESSPSTPELHSNKPVKVPNFSLSEPVLKIPLPVTPSRLSGPPKSIVEDLKDKVIPSK